MFAFDDETRRCIARYAEVALANIEGITAISAASYGGERGFAPVMSQLKGDAAVRANRDNLARIKQSAVDGDWTVYVADLRGRGVNYAKAGTDYASWSAVYQRMCCAIVDFLFTVVPDREDVRHSVKGAAALFDFIVHVVGETYFEAYNAAIRELSTPILLARDRVLLVPLVGALDDTRMRHLHAKLLTAVRDERARAVVVDLTGVLGVDSAAMDHLGRLASSASLMGARVVLSGLAPDVCRALVTLGIETPNAETVGTLAEALDVAAVST